MSFQEALHDSLVRRKSEAIKNNLPQETIRDLGLKTGLTIISIFNKDN